MVLTPLSIVNEALADLARTAYIKKKGKIAGTPTPFKHLRYTP
jgi:hypothetical protein